MSKTRERDERERERERETEEKIWTLGWCRPVWLVHTDERMGRFGTLGTTAAGQGTPAGIYYTPKTLLLLADWLLSVHTWPFRLYVCLCIYTAVCTCILKLGPLLVYLYLIIYSPYTGISWCPLGHSKDNLKKKRTMTICVCMCIHEIGHDEIIYTSWHAAVFF
jgi:hypothetical protein